MEYKDYYEILGVQPEAGEKEIRSAFRKQARQCHPDVCPDDPQAEERFKELNEAYEALSDPEKRAKYDRLRADYQRWQRSGGRPGGFDWDRWSTGAAGAAGPAGQRVHTYQATPEDMQDLFGGGSPFSDFFSQIFGMGAQAGPEGFQQQVRPRRGQDYEQEVEITLPEAYRGTRRILQKDGRRLEVTIPPGARDGTRIRMAGEGGAGAAQGQAGDLYLRVRVASDSRFERRGDDLYVDAPVDLYTAVLGGEVRVPTLDGPVLLRIPAGTQNRRTLRLRGKGMPGLQDPEQHGDLYARVDVRLPTTLTPRQRELFEELQQIEGAEA